MRSRAVPVVLILLLALPGALAAQIGVGAHVGFPIGFGGDVALALGGSAQVRATAGFMPIEPSLTISGFDTKVKLPKTFITGGIDFFPGGSGFRIGGGVMLKPDDPTITGECTGTIQVGNQNFPCDQVGIATATAESKRSMAPYAMIGFGKHASSGIGLFVDLGAAFVGESDLTLAVDGPIRTNAQFQAELARERQEWEDKINEYKILPVLSIGLRVGIGG